jgi:hypothetical protein
MLNRTRQLLAISGIVGFLSASGMLCLSPADAGSIFKPGTTVTPGGIIQALFYAGDPSCKKLMSNLDNMYNIQMRHMTNYEANNQSWGGYTTVSLAEKNGLLVGSGNRLISTRIRVLDQTPPPPGGFFGNSTLQPFDVKQPDPMSYSIDTHTGKITFQGVYGPYSMTCASDKFAIVNTGDSIETFVFWQGPTPPR